MSEIVRTTLLASVIFSVTFSYLVYLCINVHKSLHEKNDCGMTFMWRALQFQPIPVAPSPEWSNSFGLFLYNEGYAYRDKKTIEKHEIPVLFIPGSGGSAQQVRSIGTVLQNKTEIRRAPFRYRFFAVDFGQMWSFSNGEILHNQRNFVLDAIRKIRQLTSYEKKVVLIGHSFGGTVAMSLVNHPSFDPNWVELIILKAAPISFAPVIIDAKSKFFFDEMQYSWAKKKTTTFKHIGVVSYSGGIRDFVINDKMSVPPHPAMYHRPLWSVDRVPDSGADHLCVLWCNMFVRHVSRVMYHYAENQGKLNGQQALSSYFDKEKKEMNEIAWIEKDGMTMMSKKWEMRWALKTLTISTGDRVVFDFKLPKGETISFNVTGGCVKSVSAFRKNGLMHVSRAKKGRASILIYRPNEDEDIKLLIIAEPMCRLTITSMTPGDTRAFRWYEAILATPHVAIFSFILFSFRYALIENQQIETRMAELAATTTLMIMTGVCESFTIHAHGFVSIAIGGSVAVVYHHFLSLSLHLIGQLIKKDLLNFHIVDSTVDIIYPWIVVHAFIIPTVGNMFLIVLFALRSSLRAALFCIPVVAPLVFKTLYNAVPFLQTLDLSSTQHLPLIISIIAYYTCRSLQSNVDPSFITSLVIGVALFDFMSDQLPLEIIPGIALILLTISRFTDNVRGEGYSYYNIPPHNKND